MTSATNVEFFFDPSCPWTWVTSRWLATVAPERHLSVTWRPWSLPMKNHGRELPAHLPPELRQRILAGHAFATSALRVLEAAGAEEGDEARGRLYTELGRRFHGDREGGESADQLIAAAVAACGLPVDLDDAADDETWDDALRATMDEIATVIGDDVGVPIIAIRDDDRLMAMSGPVLAEVPPRPRALALWDAVAAVTREPAIFELKRHRTGGPVIPVLDADGRLA